jgi:hypothetical protein
MDRSVSIGMRPSAEKPGIVTPGRIKINDEDKLG